jgi:hypothetical protein
MFKDPGPFILRGWMNLKDGITPDPNLAYPLSYINFTLYNFRDFMRKLSIWKWNCCLVKLIYKIMTLIKIDFVFVLDIISPRLFLFHWTNLFSLIRNFPKLQPWKVILKSIYFFVEDPNSRKLRRKRSPSSSSLATICRLECRIQGLPAYSRWADSWTAGHASHIPLA